MADALVEQRSPSARFFCHRCNIEFDHVLQDFTCPFCASGFIEQLEGDAEAPGSGDEFSDADMSTIDEMSNLDDSDEVHQTTPPMLNDLAFLMSGGRLRGTATGTGRRETLMEQLVWMIGGARTQGQGGNAPNTPFVLVGAPGDYVFGGEGLDAVVTQLLGQLENAGPPPLPRDRLDTLPSEPVTEAHTTATCSICWEHFTIGETISRLECDHIFHCACITPWLQLHATCPICRHSLLPTPAEGASNPAPSTVGTSALGDSDTNTSTTGVHSNDGSTSDPAPVPPNPLSMLLGLMLSWFTELLQPLLSPATPATPPQPRGSVVSMRVNTNPSLPSVVLHRLPRGMFVRLSSQQPNGGLLARPTQQSDTSMSTSSAALSSDSSSSLSSRGRNDDRDNGSRARSTDRYNMDIDFD